MQDLRGWVTDGADMGTISVEIKPDHEIDRTEKGGYPSVGTFWAEVEIRQEGEVGAIGSADVFRKKKKSAINGPWAPTTGGWFAVAYGPFRRLCGTSPDAQRLMMIPGRIPRFATLFKEDATLGEGEEWVKELQYKRLEGGQGESRALENLLSVVGDDFLRNGVAIRSLQAYGQRLRAGDRGSERRRRPSLHRPPRGSPHRRDRRPSAPRLAAEIGFWLKQHFPHVQFVVTTHSPLVCPAADGSTTCRSRVRGSRSG